MFLGLVDGLEVVLGNFDKQLAVLLHHKIMSEPLLKHEHLSDVAHRVGESIRCHDALLKNIDCCGPARIEIMGFRAASVKGNSGGWRRGALHAPRCALEARIHAGNPRIFQEDTWASTRKLSA